MRFTSVCFSRIHYKEYLVGLINKNKVDPVDIMGVKELERCFIRMGKPAPKLNKNENEQQYKKRLAQVCGYFIIKGSENLAENIRSKT